MSASDDVAAIAGKLSEQMRMALTFPKEPRLIPRTLYSQTIMALERRGLSDPASYRLTALGLAVRAHLASASHSEQPRG